MKLFKLEWYWYEETIYWLYVHPTKTDEEFDADVKNLLITYGDEYIKSGAISWIMVNEWIAFISDKLQVLGYEMVYPHTWNFFGGFILNKDDTDWKGVVGDRLFNKAVAINEEIGLKREEELDRLRENQTGVVKF